MPDTNGTATLANATPRADLGRTKKPKGYKRVTRISLGDSVYAEVRYGMLLLSVDYGSGAIQELYLDPPVARALAAYIDALQAEVAHG